jgi:hypothetical protein
MESLRHSTQEMPAKKSPKCYLLDKESKIKPNNYFKKDHLLWWLGKMNLLIQISPQD